MVRFIDTHRGAYGVEPICAVLPIAPSRYYEAKARERTPERRPVRTRRDEVLAVQVQRVWREHRTVYGVRKVWKQDRKSTRLNSSHVEISYAVFCLKKKNQVSLR